MDLADHFRVIAASWRRILVIALIATLVVFVFSSTRSKTYESGTLLSVATQEFQTGGNNFQTEQQIAFRAEFFAQIAKTQTVAAAAVKKEKLQTKYGLTPKAALGRISLVTNQTSGFILINARARRPLEAAAIANGFASGLQDEATRQANEAKQREIDAVQIRINNTQSQLKQAQDRYDSFTDKNSVEANRVLTFITAFNNAIVVAQQALVNLQTTVSPGVDVIAGALPARNPVSPRPARDSLLAFLVALVLAAEGTVVVRAFSDRFARAPDPDAITEYTGLPVLAMIPRARGAEVVEAFRTLRTNLLFLEGAGRPRTIALVSPNPGAGKSFSALNLAESALAVDSEVVLIDADLRRPVLHARLRIEREPGLSDALRGMPLEQTLHHVNGVGSLSVIPSGSPVTDTAGILGGRAFRQVLDALVTAELVVVDTPPGSVYSDALAVSAQCDATLLVLDAKTTRRRAAKRLIESLERTGATVIGVVVNGATVNRRDTYERY